MSTWAPIVPVSVDVIGVHPQQHDLLIVKLVLSARPPTAWRALLMALQPSVTVDDYCITLNAADDWLEQTVEALGEAITRTNSGFAATQAGPRPDSAPSHRSERVTVDLQEGVSSTTLERIMEARKKAASMSGVFQSSLWETVAEGDDDSA